MVTLADQVSVFATKEPSLMVTGSALKGQETRKVLAHPKIENALEILRFGVRISDVLRTIFQKLWLSLCGIDGRVTTLRLRELQVCG